MREASQFEAFLPTTSCGAVAAVMRWSMTGFAFWAMNGGLFAMCVFSLLPVGLLQTWASVEHGYWYARSSEFLGTPLMQNLRWLRVPGDTLFAVGAAALVVFVASIRIGRLPRKTTCLMTMQECDLRKATFQWPRSPSVYMNWIKPPQKGLPTRLFWG